MAQLLGPDGKPVPIQMLSYEGQRSARVEEARQAMIRSMERIWFTGRDRLVLEV